MRPGRPSAAAGCGSPRSPYGPTSENRQCGSGGCRTLDGVMDDRSRYEAVSSRDARFDGAFFFAVVTTGIYCRPSCPAVTPRRANVRFYPTAAAAQAGGFRACRRCRPDAVPGSAEWNVRADVVGRAMRLIGDGVVDREGVPGLAGRLGYSARQVQRQLNAELGAGPVALARAQRAHTARVLLQTTVLPVTEIAFAPGSPVCGSSTTPSAGSTPVPPAPCARRPGPGSAAAGPRAARRDPAATRPSGPVRRRGRLRPARGGAVARVEELTGEPGAAPTGVRCGCRTGPGSSPSTRRPPDRGWRPGSTSPISAT